MPPPTGKRLDAVLRAGAEYKEAEDPNADRRASDSGTREGGDQLVCRRRRGSQHDREDFEADNRCALNIPLYYTAVHLNRI